MLQRTRVYGKAIALLTSSTSGTRAQKSQGEKIIGHRVEANGTRLQSLPVQEQIGYFSEGGTNTALLFFSHQSKHPFSVHLAKHGPEAGNAPIHQRRRCTPFGCEERLYAAQKLGGGGKGGRVWGVKQT